MTHKHIDALAENLWRGAVWQYPLKNASAHYQDQYRRIARFLSESGCFDKFDFTCSYDGEDVESFLKRKNTAVEKLIT